MSPQSHENQSINTEVSVEEKDWELDLEFTLGDSLEKEGREAKHSEVSLEQNLEEKERERTEKDG